MKKQILLYVMAGLCGFGIGEAVVRGSTPSLTTAQIVDYQAQIQAGQQKLTDLQAKYGTDERLIAEMDAQQKELEQQIAQSDIRVQATQQAVQAACRARLLNIEAQERLAPPSSVSGLVIQLIESAIASQQQKAAATQSGDPQ